MSDLESLRPLYEAATANTVDGLTAAEELVKAVGRLLDGVEPEAHPVEECFYVQEHEGGRWVSALIRKDTIAIARERLKRLRARHPDAGRLRIIRKRTTYTVVETEEAAR